MQNVRQRNRSNTDRSQNGQRIVCAQVLIHWQASDRHSSYDQVSRQCREREGTGRIGLVRVDNVHVCANESVDERGSDCYACEDGTPDRYRGVVGPSHPWARSAGLLMSSVGAFAVGGTHRTGQSEAVVRYTSQTEDETLVAASFQYHHRHRGPAVYCSSG